MTYAQITALSRSHYTRLQTSRPGHHTSTQIKAGMVMPMGNLIIVLVLVCLLIVIYLLQVNATNRYSYVINDLTQQQARLQTEYDTLSLEATKLESNQRVIDEQIVEEYQLPQYIYLDTSD